MDGRKMHEPFNQAAEDDRSPLRFSTIAQFMGIVILGVLAMAAFAAYREAHMSETQFMARSKRFESCVQFSMAVEGTERSAAQRGCRAFFFEADGHLPRE